MDIPRQVQDRINQFQGLQNQLQAIVLQKQQLILQSTDIDNALTALKKIDKERLYEATGPLLIETDKPTSEKKLRENKDVINAKIQMLERQEKKLTEKLKELSTEIRADLEGSGIVGG
ncbi:MAG TPA: prefoldin subunit beta [Candidatus Altiarchaeales archaeon]|nr:MAG: prefoldin subunit beta [Candidatus Altiarchaeales archaeon ex4484_43]HDH41217.1 prefoldin subunit beta [Candidatus Altiarchaeales archaeon]